MSNTRLPQTDSVAEPSLRRTLGLGQTVALGVSGTLGGGIFVLVGSVVGNAGPAAPLAFLLAFASALCIALPYAELAARLPLTGGSYAAIRAAIGPVWAYVDGWVYLGAWIFGSGFVTLGFGAYVESLTGLPRVPTAVALVAVLTAFNLCARALTHRLQAVAVLLSGGALTGFCMLAAPNALTHADHLGPLFPNGLAGVAMATPAAFIALNGFDTVAAAGEEVVRPERTLPRAIVLTLIIAMSLYMLVTLGALGSLPWQVLGTSATPLADAAQSSLGPLGARLIALVAIVTTANSANATLMIGSRVLLAMARDHMLPRHVARVHPRIGAPYVAVLLTGAGMAAMALGGTVPGAAAVCGLLYILHYLFPLASLVRERKRGGPPPAFQSPVPHLLLPVAGLVCAVLLGASAAGILGGAAWLLIGIMLQVVRRPAATRVFLIRGWRGCAGPALRRARVSVEPKWVLRPCLSGQDSSWE